MNSDKRSGKGSSNGKGKDGAFGKEGGSDKGGGKKGGYSSKGGGKRSETLPVVTEHMNKLLALPDADRASCSSCTAYEYTRQHPAPALPSLAPVRANTIFGTVELDTFQAGAALLQQGWPQPVVLNMANEHNCGGAWCQKPGSQEEDLLRCSSLPLSLWPRRLPSDHRMPEFDGLLPRAESIYPFAEAGVIYSPKVIVCRNRKGDELPQVQQFVVSVISSAAQDLRADKPHYQGPFHAGLTAQKMRSMLWAAAHYGHTAVVLGAYGCGAFKNDPYQVAQLYWKLLGPGGEFEGCFSIVIFAIIKSNYNLHAFCSVFDWLRNVPPMPVELPAVPKKEVVQSTLTDSEKEALKLLKKVRDVFKLDELLAAGTNLAGNQQQKLSHKAEWIADLKALEAGLPSDSNIHQMIADVMERDAPRIQMK